MKYKVYILYSPKLNRFYTGFSTNYEVRLRYHAEAESGKFTAKSDDWIEFLLIDCFSKRQGLAIENHIKKMKSSKYIQNLKRYPEMIQGLIERY